MMMVIKEAGNKMLVNKNVLPLEERERISSVHVDIRESLK